MAQDGIGLPQGWYRVATRWYRVATRWYRVSTRVVHVWHKRVATSRYRFGTFDSGVNNCLPQSMARSRDIGEQSP